MQALPKSVPTRLIAVALILAFIFGLWLMVANQSSPKLTAEQAKQIAVKDAQVSVDKVHFLRERIKTENNRQLYVVAFYTETDEYVYEIDARTGDIVKRADDIEGFTIPHTTPPVSPKNRSTIDESRAVALALEDAGIDASQARYTTVSNDDSNEYAVTFYDGSHAYDYAVDAETGVINERTSEPASLPHLIDEQTAMQIAVQEAGLQDEDVTFDTVQLQRTKTGHAYAVVFHLGEEVYHYDINADKESSNETESHNE